MGIFDGLLNMFKDTNTTTPTAPAATHQTGNAAGHPTYRMAPQYQPVRRQAQSPAKPAAASSDTGAANWFNGIGTASASKQTDSLTVYSLKGTPLHLTAQRRPASESGKARRNRKTDL